MKNERVGRDQLAALGVTVIVASLAVGFLAIGCGQQQSETATTETGTIQSADAGKAPVAANTAASATGIKETTPPAGQAADAAGDSMPPDVLAKASADYVTPGEIVEITAQGTPDVVEVILKDGSGKTQPLVYDQAAAAWRARYRVPLHPATERLGLSVTAKSAQKLQQRVWLFLQVREAAVGEPAGSAAEPDSQ